MSDVTDAPAARDARARGRQSDGGFIWYELMTPDPAAAKRFYDAVVGWDIGDELGRARDRISDDQPADGGNAGGVLTLTDEMKAGGARPIWLGYLHRRRRCRGRGHRGRRRPGADAAVGPARRRPAGDGRRPAGRALLPDGPDPARGQPDADSDVFSVDQPQHVRWNELSTSDPDAAIDFYKRHFGWTQEGDMHMGEMGKYRFVQHDGVGDRRGHADDARHAGSPCGTSTSASTTSTAPPRPSTPAAGRSSTGPMEIPGGEYAVNAVDPQGALFGLVGPRKHKERENG